MCGFYGFVGEVAVDVLAMQRAIAPRGPDFQCLEQGEHFALGMARLRVVDDDPASDPPWRSSDGSVSAVLNGEIVNHAELRRLLVEQGHRPRSGGDGELIPPLYQRYGASFLGMLRGPFALAVHDHARRTLLLARDRFGKKPLAFAEVGEGLVFASDLKTMVAAQVLPCEPDLSGVRQYLADGFVTPPRTLMAGVSTLPPGHALTWVERGPPSLQRFGDVMPSRIVRADRRALSDHIGQALARAVAARLESPRRKIVLLSGGIDSGLIASFARDVDPGIESVTLRTGLDAGELVAAERTARHLDLDWQVIDMPPFSADVLTAFVARIGEPIGDSSALACDALFHALSGRYAVALAGEGGDELFCGYRRLQALALSQLPLVHRLSAAAAAAPNVPAARGPVRQLRRFAAGAVRPPAQRLAFWRSLFDDDQISRLCPGEREAPAGGEWRGRRALLAQGVLDEVRGPLQGLLAKVDRTSMAHGIEVRCPFLDEEVAARALAAPLESLFSLRRTKPVLRRLARSRLPRKVVRKRKTGFGVPVSAWLRLPDVHDLAREVCASAELVDRAAASAVLAEHAGGRADHGQRLFALLTLELWFAQARRMRRP